MKTLQILSIASCFTFFAEAKATNLETIVLNNELINKQHRILKERPMEQDHVYVWEVESNYGRAQGTSINIENAKKMIALVSKSDIKTYTIIVDKKVK